VQSALTLTFIVIHNMLAPSGYNNHTVMQLG